MFAWIRAHRKGLLAGFIFLILSLAFHWRSVERPMTYAGSMSDELLVAWTLEWDAKFLLRPHGSLFDAPFFAPLPRTLAFSENLIGEALLLWPATFAADWPLLALNIFSVLSSLLMAWSMWLLARAWGASFWGAIVGAGIATFAPPRFFHAPAHPHMLALWWIPLGIWCWHRWIERREMRWLMLLGVCIVGQGLMSLQGLIIFFTALVIVGAITIPRAAWKFQGRMLGIAAALALFVLTPLLAPYVLLSFDSSVLWFPESHRILNTPALTDMLAPVFALPWLDGEYQVSFGIAPLVGVMFAFVSIFRDRAAAARRQQLLTALMLCIGGVLIALGPEMRFVQDGASVPGVYTLLKYVPGFSGIRAVNRFLILTLIGMGLLVALQWQTMVRACGRGGRWIAWIGAAFIVAEFATVAPPALIVDSALLAPRPLDQWLATLPPACTVAEVPFKDYRTREEESALFLYYTQIHGKRIINGYSGAVPQGYFPLEHDLHYANADEAIDALKDWGIDMIVVHPSLFAPLRAEAMLAHLRDRADTALMTRFPDTFVFRFKGARGTMCL